MSDTLHASPTTDAVPSTSSHARHLASLYAAISRRAGVTELATYWHPDAVQVEHPSLLRPAGHQRGLAELLEASNVGLQMIDDQHYDVHNIIEEGERVAVQLTWSATTAVDLPGLAAGTQLVSHVAAFYEFRDGLLLSQSSYDCYEPLPSAAKPDEDRARRRT
jgi:predicted ester cyclase